MYHMTTYLSTSTFNMIGKLPIVCGTLTIYLIMYASIPIGGYAGMHSSFYHRPYNQPTEIHHYKSDDIFMIM